MKRRFLATAMLVVLVAVSANCGCAPSGAPKSPTTSVTSHVTTAPPVADLGAVEVRNYRGRRLDAVSSEPETSIKGPQHIDVKAYRLAVTGLVSKPLSLTYDDVTAMPAHEKVTTLKCIDGWSVTYLWRGVLVKDLLARAGYDPGAKIVIFRCADGFSTSLSLDFLVGRDILLAYRMNGVVMAPERGFPFQVVAEDLLGYKWAKWVTSIEVSDNTSFTGYWESRGAENTPTVAGSN